MFKTEKQADSADEIQQQALAIYQENPNHPSFHSETFPVSSLFREMEEIKSSDTQKKKRSYSLGFLKFCLMVNSTLGVGKYNALRRLDFIPLPKSETLSRLLESGNDASKLTDPTVLDIYKKMKNYFKANDFRPPSNLVNTILLTADEVDVQERLIIRGDQIIGNVEDAPAFVSFTNVTSNNLAGAAMVFVIRHLVYTEFRHPVCVLAVKSNPNAEEYENYWETVISRLVPLFRIIVTTSDAKSGHKTAFASFKQKYDFDHLPDASHVLKRACKAIVDTNVSNPRYSPYGPCSAGPL